MKKILSLLAVFFCVLSINAKVIYLVPNDWRADDAAFFVHSWGGGSDVTGKMIKEADNLYSFDIAENTSCLFVRQDPTLGNEINWDKKWNQTGDLVIPADKNCYTITGWGQNDGTWSLHDGSTTDPGTDPTPDPNAKLVYNVTVPAGTFVCYIAGEMNKWSHTEMTKVDDNHYTIELAGATAAMKYKYCSGPSWDYVEKTATGDELQDRTYTANDVVAKWLAVYNPNDTTSNPGTNPGVDPDPNATDTVFFVNSNDWSKVNVYAWQGDAFNVAWPGAPAQKVAYQLQNKDVYYYAAVPGAYASVIFNDGTNQTADLIWTSGKYYYNNKWYTRAELEGGDVDIRPDYPSSVPSQCPDVMLQGFYWDSNQDNKAHGNTRWTTLLAQATEIAAYFDLVWLPPSAKSSGGVGYHPKQYNNQNSDWGKRSDLEKLIAAFHEGGTKVLADIVVNHIDGKSGWCDYYEQNFGEYGSFKVDGSYICQDDEVNWDADDACKGSAVGAYDDGYGDEAKYGAARDLAHNEEHVRQMCRAYTQWMVDVMKYDGFRYDYCKGFHMSHVDDYNAAAGAYFSVVEYWDGNADVLWSRIQDARENTLAFDFGVKYQALNNGIAAGNYSGCKAPGLLGKGKSKYAVTFVDSHDSYQRDDNEFGGYGNSMKDYMKGKVLQANAFILSMPGIPCISYPHWTVYKNEIAAMILARKAVGVHSESAVSDEGDNAGYRAWVSGTNGTLLLELGNRVSGSQNGFTKVASGDGYAIYTQTGSAVAPILIVTPGSTTYKTETLQVQMRTVGASNATIYYTLDGTDPKTSATKNTYSAELTIKGTVTLKAYAVADGQSSDVQTYTYTYQEPQETPLTVKFMPPTSWDKVYLYAWDANGGTLTGSWPGLEWNTMDNQGWLFHIFDAQYREVNIIFNNGEGVQSGDILLDQDACYKWDEINATEQLSDECSISDIPFQIVVNPEGKVYKTESLDITLSTIGGDEVSTIYYTLDGSTPTTSSTTYSAPITIKGSVTLKAFAESNGETTDVVTHEYIYEAPQATPITVAFSKPEAWAKVYLYSWNDGGAVQLTGAWPGTEMTNRNDVGLYYHQFDASVVEVNFIFNNGSGVQTADLYTDEDVCYGWENDKAIIIDCSGNGVEDVEINDIPALDYMQPMFNVLGQQVGADYQGIIIQNGHKYIR